MFAGGCLSWQGASHGVGEADGDKAALGFIYLAGLCFLAVSVVAELTGLGNSSCQVIVFLVA